jgi:mRNA interferase MazF
MMNFSQGDIIKISNLKDAMLVVSKNQKSAHQAYSA